MQIFQLLNMFGMTEKANISLIFPEIALNHCCPNAMFFPAPFLPSAPLLPPPPKSFLQSDFYQAQVNSVSSGTADGWMSNTSQEDPPTAAELENPGPLAPDGRPTAPPASGPRGKPSLPPPEQAARRGNKKCCSLQGKEDKSRKDIGMFVPTKTCISLLRPEVRAASIEVCSFKKWLGGHTACVGFALSTLQPLG